jgi:uncharacterized protein YbjT (DUF2867 family)
MRTILITGATGTVGSKVVKRLAGSSQITVRAACRSAASAEELRRLNVTPVDFDFEKPDLVAAALRGVDKLFMVVPAIRDQVGVSTRFLELARAAGVTHVVKQSALECDKEPTIAFGRAHRDVERVLTTSQLAWTFLRPNNFMDNFLGIRHGAFAPDETRAIRLPWGTGACSFIAADDIAAVAAKVLVEDGHAGKTYELTGPEALRIDQVAELMASATGLPFNYVNVPEEVARRAMLEIRLPPPLIDGVLELHALGRAGRAAVITSAVAEVTGAPARGFAAFAEAAAASWRTR